MLRESRYPTFDVMDAKDEWDDHTQSIVTSRIELHESLQFFTLYEAEIVRRISSLLVDDFTSEVMYYVVRHIDETLYQSLGEGQRKAGVPAASVLVRTGLKAIELGAIWRYGRSFMKLELAEQKQYLQDISESAAEPEEIWGPVPQQELFQKLRQLTVESYCSHPRVWSEIGYAGPAYPRGYVRTQLGQLDPWEAHAKP
jgi:hypothetical protein